MNSNKLFIKEEIDELNVKERIKKFEEIIQKSKEQKFTKIVKEKKKFSFYYRGLPAELMNELFASLPLENAFSLLAKMPNGLLARNVQKMSNNIKMTMKTNKWDLKYSGKDLTISENGLSIKHFSPEGQNWARSVLPIPTILKLKVKKLPIVFGHNWVRSIMPISTKFNLKANIKPSIAFYYEVEICKKNRYSGINIGFNNGPLPEYQMNYFESLGFVPNSIGIWHKREMRIYDDSESFYARFKGFEYGNADFNEGDVIGMGIIHLPAHYPLMYCFATINGKLLGKTKLPQDFANLQLFPSTNLYFTGDSIRANFGKEEWRFKQFDEVLQ